MSGERIIIAEDNCVMLDVMRFVLSGAGFEVLAAEDGFRALSLLETNGADLLITDCQMPGISGLELCQQIRDNPRFCTLPVIFCSAKGFEISRETLDHLRVTDIICKPFSPRELVRHVQLVFDNGPVINANETSEVHRSLPVTI